MKIKHIIFVLFALILTSCNTGMSILVKIIGLENMEEPLELEFTFKDKLLKEDVNILNIMIFKNGTLQYELEAHSDTTNLTRWHFPNIPKAFKMKFPETEKSIRQFNRTDNITFEFSGQNKKRGVLSEWKYKSSYLNKENRWMFDEDGNKIVNIESTYESWLGKDIIKIYANANLNIENESLKLTNSNNEKVAFELRSKKDNHNIIVLTLDNDLEKGETLNLTFKTKEGNNFSDHVIVKGRSNIGIVGKYSKIN